MAASGRLLDLGQPGGAKQIALAKIGAQIEQFQKNGFFFDFFDDQIHAMPVDDLLDVFNGDLTARMTHFGKYDVLIDFHVFEAMPRQIAIIDIKTAYLVNGKTEPERG